MRRGEAVPRPGTWRVWARHRLAPTLLLLFFISPVSGKTLFGIDVLEKTDFKSLDGANVGLITNHTGLNRRGKSTVDILHKSKNVNLVAILTPEHGFRGEVEDGKEIQNGRDPKTGVPIYSLYGKTKRPTQEMLNGIDILIFDIQDIGTRFYTYITTMGQAMEEAGTHQIKFMVLDRPNPIRGDIIEGDVLDSDVKRFTGYFQIPTRHGLTVGELANWFNTTQQLNVPLQIVKMKNWSRDMWYDQTGYEFHPTSPNIPKLVSALLYAGIGNFEATNVSVGRGTDKPFEIFGAPWINGRALVAYLRKQNFQGVAFEPHEFIPEKSLYKGELCSGVRLIVTNRATIKPFDIFVASFKYLFDTHPDDFKPVWKEIKVVTGSDHLKDSVENNASLEEIYTGYLNAQQQFLQEISPFYLY